ncbi:MULTISPECIES: glutamyl-tRNA reductase [Corynebacterium]|uniref:Glutamyl-tRNA reductase n=1 Tax=Corynebacterium aurimucosum TaxID=169292 RepID=A0A558IM96_9CORY|nr:MULTISPECIES: glutamyl-tRNA reductase [Corynebacterium]OFK64648.1 glutamyl-tRNA reductase [Corynebacterium sp. HMSC074A09]OFK69770.1 glutamyl-tRNA reductase [Corynebacterium sp. HMSC076G08]OFO19493.1 glutamyl-tRNA reductase [Corynebacterium sp. HMSC056F09]OFP32259.1 glutamyl-tRNA reductase [Corynebacterium sp. HMSC068G04]TVU82490.1 glutamyl-tRNA reductase [Corynebacterium aurimucosum]
MSVLVVGMSHQSAPVALLEKLSMDETVQNDTCRAMVSAGSLSEAMIISTCNRLEVYTVTNSFHTGVQDVVRNLADVSGVEEEKLRSYLYVRYADAVAEHLMMVASGLDSMVVGEQQIIGQVRTAYQFASEQGTVGPRIHALAQSALRTGKRVHSETEIDEAGSSMVSFAFDQALSRMGREDLAGKRVLILGAGAMASLAATHAGRLGAQLIIANRTIARAERVAQHAHEAGVYADVIDFSERAQALRDVDVAISATGAQGFTITAADVERYHVADRELMLVDLSLPRDIDDAVAEVEGVDLVNIERLSNSLQAADTDLAAGTSPHAQARRIVSEELEAYASEQRVRDVVPAVSALRKRAANLVQCEVARLEQKHPELDERQMGDINRALKRVADKLLHEPTVRAKQLAANSGTVSHETALQELFGLHLEGSGVAVDVAELPDAAQMEAAESTKEEKDA